MPPDNRHHPRYALDVAVQLEHAGGRVHGRTRNMSRGGLCAYGGEPLPPGTEVTIHMALVFDCDTFSEPLVVHGRVMWCTALGATYQIGAAFAPLSAEQLEFLAMFLRYLDEGRAARDDDAPAPDDPFGA